MNLIFHSTRREFFIASLLGVSAFTAFSETKRPNILLLLGEDLGYGVLGCYGNEKAKTPHIDSIADKGVRLTHYYSAACTPNPSILSLLTGRYPQRVKRNDHSLETWPEKEPSLAAWMRDVEYETAWFGDGLIFPQNNVKTHGFGSIKQTLGKDQLFDHAREWIRTHGERPWFLCLNMGPCSKEKINKIDQEIGALLDVIKQTGKEENSFVILCGLNGSAKADENQPFSGGKSHLREGGIRLPCILRWPRYLPEGRVCSQAAMSMDLSATILLGARRKPQRHIDGMDLMRILNGSRNEVDQTLVWRNAAHDEIALRWGKWKWLREQGKDFLFNLIKDPGETRNLKEEHIDILHWLKGIYRQWDEAMKK